MALPLYFEVSSNNIFKQSHLPSPTNQPSAVTPSNQHKCDVDVNVAFMFLFIFVAACPCAAVRRSECELQLGFFGRQLTTKKL